MAKKVFCLFFAIVFVLSAAVILPVRADAVIGAINTAGAPKHRMTNAEKFKKINFLNKKAQNLQIKADKIAESKPEKAAKLKAKADKMLEKASLIKPSNVGINKYEQKQNKLNKVLKNNPNNKEKINTLTNKINNQIVPDGLGKMEKKYNNLTEKAAKLEAKAAGLDPAVKPKKVQKLQNKVNNLRERAEWIKTSTENTLKPVRLDSGSWRRNFR